jgi:predicted dehydrogenase
MVGVEREQPVTAAPPAELRVAVVGAGYWGPNLVRNFFEAPGSTVVAAADLSADRLAGIGRRYPTLSLTTDVDELLRDPRVDAVAIATPTATHYELARRALEAGKHVWVEKPLAPSYAEAMRLTELAHRKRLTLMVDHTFVYTGAVRAMRERIDSGELGELLYYDSVRVNLGLYQHDVNVIWDLGIHDVSIVDYLLPFRPVAVSAQGARHIGSGDSVSESIAYVTLHYEQNFIAHFHVNWLAPVKIRLTTLCGAERMIVYDDMVPSEKLRIYDRGVTVNGDAEHDRRRLLVEYRSGDMYAPKLDPAEALQSGARHFAASIAAGTPPITDGLAGSRAVALLEAAQQSLQQGGRLVRVSW